MQIQSRVACAVALSLAATIGMTALSSAAEQQTSPAKLKHAPVHLRRGLDGNLERGVRGQFISSNWSGYVVANYQTGRKYTSAQMTWVVPAVKYGSSNDTTSSNEYSANWVGIGGFCENVLCTLGDNTLIQLGTEQDVSPSGEPNYYAWYEVLPRAETPLGPGYPVHPKDTITASLSCNQPCSSRKQTWTLSMHNETAGWKWSKQLSYGSSLLSAEWIEEAPYEGGILPLADFLVASFPGPNVANGSLPPVSSGNVIQMADPWGQWANPSLAPVPNFNVCWAFESFVSC